MDYLLTFEDGSSGYLAHHGVKGMKWGVRNSETKARYSRNSSSGQYPYGVDKLSSSEQSQHKKLINDWHDKQKAFEKIDDAAFKAEELGWHRAEKHPGWKEAQKARTDADNKLSAFEKEHKLQEEGSHLGNRYAAHDLYNQDRLFVSGSSKTQFKDSGYYRRKLPREVRKELKGAMKSGDKILVGDAPGVDRQVQDYLNKKRYANVEVYGPDIQPRYKAGKNWVFNAVNDSKSKPGSKEWLAKKDVAMTNRSTKGLAVTLDEGANATRRNVERLRSQGKDAIVYELSKNGRRKDRWVDSKTVKALS